MGPCQCCPLNVPACATHVRSLCWLALVLHREPTPRRRSSRLLGDSGDCVYIDKELPTGGIVVAAAPGGGSSVKGTVFFAPVDDGPRFFPGALPLASVNGAPKEEEAALLAALGGRGGAGGGGGGGGGAGADAAGASRRSKRGGAGAVDAGGGSGAASASASAAAAPVVSPKLADLVGLDLSEANVAKVGRRLTCFVAPPTAAVVVAVVC